jgi:cyclophilin family peptidyl-prolyl cis-trans isomerase
MLKPFVEALEQRQLLAVSLDPLGPVIIPGGKSVIVPINATTTGTSVKYTLTTSSTSIKATLLTGLKFVQMNVSIDGVAQAPLILALFAKHTPKTVAHIEALVRSGFYDNKAFHRIIPGFMAQGGGKGDGPAAPQVDDEFYSSLIFSGKHLLAMANHNGSNEYGQPDGTVSDTNTSEFFITADKTRWLDFKHTIFGALISGAATFDAMMAAGTAGGAPTKSVVITSATMISNAADGVILLKAPTGASGTVSVTATDSLGAKTKRTFAASGVADTFNVPPFLGPLPKTISTFKNVPVQFVATATDVDGPTPYISGYASKGNLQQSGNAFTYTPPADFSGTDEILIGVWRSSEPQTDQFGQTVYDGEGEVVYRHIFDTQRLTVNVSAAAFATKSSTGVLTISGTSLHDVIRLSLNSAKTTLYSYLNGKRLSFAYSGIKSVSVISGDGNDSIIVASTITRPTTLSGGAGNDTIEGGSGRDLVRGGDGNDSINGAAGSDILYGDAGDDRIWGGSGNDSILGGVGSDWVDAGSGNDTVKGGDGNDYLIGGSGYDRLYGEGGNDALLARDSAKDTLSGGAGTDVGKWDSTDRRLDSLGILK